MQRIDPALITPIYVKTTDDMPWPDHPVFYLLSADSLYLCRNHRHYRSCVPAPRWPTELAPHAASLVPRFPTIPRDQLEQICGFFSHLSDHHGAESIALLAWDESAQQVRTLVPRQIAAVSQSSSGHNFPIGVKYQFPRGLPADWVVFCDIHSHCEMAAYASQTDIDDEFSFAGLHLVVGRLYQEPPQFHAEGVVDGARFSIEPDHVIEGYRHRVSFPDEWLDQVVVTDYRTFRDFDFDNNSTV